MPSWPVLRLYPHRALDDGHFRERVLIFVFAAIMKQASLSMGETLGRVAALYTCTTSSHRVINAMRVGYKDQSVSVVQGTWLVCENHTGVHC